MNQKIPSHKARDLARRLIAHEAAALNIPQQPTAPVFRVSEKLRGPLITFAGTASFRTLQARALQLAETLTPGSPDISAIQVDPNGSLAGLSEYHNDGKAADAGMLVIAHLLELLVLFIGESLVLRLIQNAWADLPVDPELQKENQHDATKIE